MYLNEEEYTSWSAGLDFIIFSKTSFVNVLGFKSNPICKNISYKTYVIFGNIDREKFKIKSGNIEKYFLFFVK